MSVDREDPHRRESRFTVTPDQADRRLDRVLRGLYRDVPLGAIMKAVRKGAVQVNGMRPTGGWHLREGDEVVVPWEQAESQPMRAARDKTPLVTLLRNRDVWCVDKPPGLLSQPDRRTDDSVITRAWAELSWERRDFRPALIHRLDRNVSGVLVIALNAPILRLLSALMRDGMIRKRYRAIVAGTPKPSGEIRLPLYKDERANRVRVDQRGQEALTRYVTLRGDGKHALVELELVTGRPHQARAHLSAIGHPIVGDFKYGDGKCLPAMNKRLFLHAYSLFFPNSANLSEELKGAMIKTPMPADFNRFVHEFT